MFMVLMHSDDSEPPGVFIPNKLYYKSKHEPGDHIPTISCSVPGCRSILINVGDLQTRCLHLHTKFLTLYNVRSTSKIKKCSNYFQYKL